MLQRTSSPYPPSSSYYWDSGNRHLLPRQVSLIAEGTTAVTYACSVSEILQPPLAHRLPTLRESSDRSVQQAYRDGDNLLRNSHLTGMGIGLSFWQTSSVRW